MAAINPPSYLQFGSHSASSDRLTVASFLQPGATPMVTRGGVRPSGDNASMRVLPQATPNNTVVVNAGTVYVPESDGQGCYVCHNDAGVTLSIAAASTTQNRKDLIVAQVFDQEVSGAANTWTPLVVSGVSVSGTATAPAVPANAYPLAEVSVPAGSTTVIGSAAITDRRATAVAAGGLLPTLSTALPANPYDKMAVYCGDDDTVRVWSASAGAWRVLSMYPLPGMTFVAPTNQVQSITATTPWATLPTRQFIDFTAPKALYAMITLGAWVQSGTGTDVRATISLTNATTGPGAAGAIVNSTTATWGESLFASGQSQYEHDSITVPYLLNSGTTRIEIVAFRNNSGATCNVNYATLRVLPLRYV